MRYDLRRGAKDWLFSSASRLCFVEGEEGEPAPDAGAAGGDAGAAAPPSLHDALSAAYDAADGQQAPAGQAQPPGAPAADQGQQQAAKTPAQLAAEQAARDEAGRFAKAGEAGQVKPVAPNAPAASGEPGAQPQTIAPPPSWSAPAKAKFAALDPIIQQEVLKRERDIETGKAEWEGKAQKFNAIDEILAPRRSQLAVAGLDDVGAVRALFAAQDMLQRTPVDALLYLGRTVNVNWNMLVQRLTGNHVAPQQPGQPPGYPPQQPPAYAPTDPRVLQQLQSVTQTVQQQQQERTQAIRSQVDTELNAFASDPANLYFANVKGEMAQIISAAARQGQQITLKDAYDRATWANPTIRPLLISTQGADQQRQAAQAAQAAAARARQASGSLAGSPTPGARQAIPKRSINDELAANWDAAATG